MNGPDGPAAPEVRARSRRRAGRSRSTSSCASPSTAPVGSTRARPTSRVDRPGAAATSSPRPRWGRCSERWWRGSSTPSGSASAVPTRSRWSMPAPARARWPARCSCQPGVRRCAPVRGRRDLGRPTRAPSRRGGVGGRAPRCERSTGWCSPTNCSTTCRSASPCTTADGARRTWSMPATAPSARRSAHRSTRSRPRCRPGRRTVHERRSTPRRWPGSNGPGRSCAPVRSW
jgi:hypothetical protein